MVSHLVTKEEANNTSEEEIVTTSKGPNVSERVSMAMQILRPTTAQMVLGTDALFLPYDHLLLQLVSDSVAVQGHVVVSSSGLVLTRLKLTIHMGDGEGKHFGNFVDDCQGRESDLGRGCWSHCSPRQLDSLVCCHCTC